MSMHRLEGMVFFAGALTVHPVIECGEQTKYSYHITCKDSRDSIPYNVCQREVKPGVVQRVEVTIPRDNDA